MMHALKSTEELMLGKWVVTQGQSAGLTINFSNNKTCSISNPNVDSSILSATYILNGNQLEIDQTNSLTNLGTIVFAGSIKISPNSMVFTIDQSAYANTENPLPFDFVFSRQQSSKVTSPTSPTSVTLLYQADLTKKDPSLTDAQAMTAVKSTIERRVNAFGVTNPIIQLQDDNRISVQIPSTTDVNQITSIIGQVALLEFKVEQLDTNGNVQTDSNGNPTWIPATELGTDGVTQETLTGKYLKPNTYVTTDNSSKPVVEFEWNTEGAKLFEEITTVLYNNGVNEKPLGIFLDNSEIAAPIVNGVIGAKGEIDGLTLTQAKNLSIELNSWHTGCSPNIN